MADAIYLGWSMAGRGAQRAALGSGSGTRVGERLTELPLTLFTDPAAPDAACTPFVAVSNSSETQSVSDNGDQPVGLDHARCDLLAYPQATAAKFDDGAVPPTTIADRRVGQSRRHDRGHRARTVADHAVGIRSARPRCSPG